MTPRAYLGGRLLNSSRAKAVIRDHDYNAIRVAAMPSSSKLREGQQEARRGRVRGGRCERWLNVLADWSWRNVGARLVLLAWLRLWTALIHHLHPSVEHCHIRGGSRFLLYGTQADIFPPPAWVVSAPCK